MSTVTGYILNTIYDPTPIKQWVTIPSRIDLPNGDVVFDASPSWAHGIYKIETGNVTIPGPVILTVGEIIDAVFPQTGTAKALFEALFEIANRLQVLEGKPTITRTQLRNWLVSKAS